MRKRNSCSVVLLLTATAVWWTPVSAPAIETADCLVCHTDKELVKTNSSGKAISLFVDEAKFSASVHTKLQCTQCHADITDAPHADDFRAKPVSCALCHKPQSETYGSSVHGLARASGKTNAANCQDCHGTHNIQSPRAPGAPLHRLQLAASCGACHAQAAHDFQQSVHGTALAAGRREAPTCTDCHSEHKIERLHGASPFKIAGQICGRCHAAERIATKYNLPADRVQTYFDSYHGLAARLGSTRAANCASCHGWHSILPSTDLASSIHPRHLAQTCGACHPDIGTKLAAGPIRIHTARGVSAGTPWIVGIVTTLYRVIIVIIIGAMLLHNGLDYLAKTRAHVRYVSAADGVARMSRFVRVQHGSMILLFALLTYTGFVHKFPDAVWSWPFHLLHNGAEVRGMIHRVAGWLFVGLLIAHLAALLGTRSGRTQCKRLWFHVRDFRDLARRQRTPGFHFSYVEKIEYWSLLWGSGVMIITGVMLICTELVLRWLPKVWLDVAQVIHYYEAVLATLAIVVWHFYAVIFDPKVYPMNPAWLTGKKAPRGPAAPHLGSSPPQTAADGQPSMVKPP